MSKCAAEDCTVMVGPQYLMCQPHWWSLPREIRAAVNSTWAGVKYDEEAYRDARQSAIDYVAKNPLKPKQRTLL